MNEGYSVGWLQPHHYTSSFNLQTLTKKKNKLHLKKLFSTDVSLDVFLYLQHASSAQRAEADSVVVKVHYVYTVALSVPLDTTYSELQERVAEKLEQPASHLRLR